VISGILTDTSLAPTNSQVFVDGKNRWIGAAPMRPDGKTESHSDA